MLLTNRLFSRAEPSKEAKSIYIFCEGAKREYQYFRYFQKIDSRVNIEIYPLQPNEDNSPTGLIDIAINCIVKTDENPNPKYEFIDNLDQVWFVVDTDEWGIKIVELREKCNNQSNWNVAQSNPCFEVWLYYHIDNEKLELKNCSEWKAKLNESVSGGFDARRQPIFIGTAIQNSERVFESADGVPSNGCTEVFNLAKQIYPLVQTRIEKVLGEI